MSEVIKYYKKVSFWSNCLGRIKKQRRSNKTRASVQTIGEQTKCEKSKGKDERRNKKTVYAEYTQDIAV